MKKYLVIIIFFVGLGIFACFKVVSYKHQQSLAKSCKLSIESIYNALEWYRKQMGLYPTTEQGLHCLNNFIRNKHAGGPICGLDDVPTDQWGTPFRYCLLATGPHVDSAGPDKRFNTGDDVFLGPCNRLADSASN